MSMESATQWILKLHEDENLRNKAKAAGSFEARQAMAKENGFEFTKLEIDTVANACKGELSEEDLDEVSGGNAASNLATGIGGLATKMGPVAAAAGA